MDVLFYSKVTLQTLMIITIMSPKTESQDGLAWPGTEGWNKLSLENVEKCNFQSKGLLEDSKHGEETDK